MSGTPEQERVRERHNGAWKRVDHFLKSKWPTGELDGKLKNDNVVTSAISTSSDSSVLILSVGFHNFVYNSFSNNEFRPWLLNQHSSKENEALAKHITETWQKMAVPNDQTQRVNTIAKHIVYDLTDETTDPQMKALICDDNGNVRVRIHQLEIWSHPRRDAPLDRVLEEKFGDTFKRERSYLKKYPENIGKITDNAHIKQEVKQKRLIEEKKKFEEQFSKFYEYYRQLENDRCIPTSYQFPTLQLALQTGDDEPDDRYGNTFTGVYSTHDNEVHLKFPANNQTARPLPTKEEVFNQLLGQTGLVYGDFFQD